ncbi:MAG: ABC transporter ATP-binding protein [Chloroflexota bacterium]|nr:ABC transporter ATP-binding protein [Chloroflexota bacterium]
MISVKDLQFTYPGSRTKTLRGLSFTVEDAEIFGFLGPSGAGKSTTQKVVIGILRDYQGTISVLNRDLHDYGNDYYERIGVSFEFPNVFNKLTARENLEFFRSMYSGDTEEPLRLLGLVGLTDAADKRAAHFSKGMKMRLNLARAFLNRPQLLFLDEPTEGQDPANARRIKDILLEKKAGGTTIFLTTHNMTVAEELCDRVAFIVDGQIKLIDSPHELMLRYGRHVLRVEYRRNNQVETEEFNLEGIGEDGRFLSLLLEAEIKTIHSMESTLEDVFIKVTGRSLA